VVLLLALPASAAGTVEVTAAPAGCGVVVTLAGLAGPSHTAVVRTTLLATGDPVPVVPQAAATAAPEPAQAPPPEPVLAAERTVTGDGDVPVVLDAAAVPDDDVRVVVAVTVDGEASAPVELVLPGCGVPPTTPTPTPEPTGSPTAEPQPTTPPTTPPAAEPTTGPTEAPAALTGGPTDPPVTSTPSPTSAPLPSPAPAVPSAPALPSPTGTASPTAAPTPSARPTTSPVPTAAPTATPLRPASPVLTAAPAPSPLPTLGTTLDLAYGAFELGTGSSGYLSLMSFAAAPSLDTAGAPEPVPAPVIAAPEGSAAGVLPADDRTGTPLEDLLPPAPGAADDEPVPAQLAAPELATDAAADPLVDLAPAAFVLSASLGGLLMAGRRRTS
jgi:hypothetical protein